MKNHIFINLKKLKKLKNMNDFNNPNKFLEALLEASEVGFDKKSWLVRHFDMFKSIVTWPKGLPPILNSKIKIGSLANIFYLDYIDTLSESGYRLNNIHFKIIIEDKILG